MLHFEKVELTFVHPVSCLYVQWRTDGMGVVGILRVFVGVLRELGWWG